LLYTVEMLCANIRHSIFFLLRNLNTDTVILNTQNYLKAVSLLASFIYLYLPVDRISWNLENATVWVSASR
jgi:beta-xylosidase